MFIEFFWEVYSSYPYHNVLSDIILLYLTFMSKCFSMQCCNCIGSALLSWKFQVEFRYNYFSLDITCSYCAIITEVTWPYCVNAIFATGVSLVYGLWSGSLDWSGRLLCFVLFCRCVQFNDRKGIYCSRRTHIRWHIYSSNTSKKIVLYSLAI